MPTLEEIMPGMRSAKGLFHICDESAEAAFVPTAAFMRNSPTWRLDVLGDILLDIQRAQAHAAVELSRRVVKEAPAGRARSTFGSLQAGLPSPGTGDAGERGGIDRVGSAVHVRARLKREERRHVISDAVSANWLAALRHRRCPRQRMDDTER